MWLFAFAEAVDVVFVSDEDKKADGGREDGGDIAVDGPCGEGGNEHGGESC